jgi:shikimate kinase
LSHQSRGHIVIIGAMGVGKTTVGQLLATELDRPFIDSDAEIEARTGESGVDIAARGGVEELHRVELEVFFDMTGSKDPSVLAPAASVVEDEAARAHLANNYTVWLVAPDDTLTERRGAGGHRRPVDAEEQAQLEQRREPLFTQVSQLILDTGELGPRELVENLTALLPESLR